MNWYNWFLILILTGGAQPKPVLDLVHIEPEKGKEYVVAELKNCQADTVRFVFSCRPEVKIREYQKVKVNSNVVRTQSTIFCPSYIQVKVITNRYVLTDSLNVGLIRKIIERNKVTSVYQ